MKQVFIFGASSVYGVGAEHAGWGDMVKSYAHGKQYGQDGSGETCEVFNFSKAGSTAAFVIDTLPWLIEQYARSLELTVLISVGGNDARAFGAADRYISTPEAFRDKVQSLCGMLTRYSEQVIFVSNGYVDETKVNPKTNPFHGSASYFTNERRSLFNAITKEECQRSGFEFVAAECDKVTWMQNFLYKDGLHPNQAGYEEIFKALKPILEKYL